MLNEEPGRERTAVSFEIPVMCGRYRRTTQEEELARLYHIPIPKQTDLPITLQHRAESENPYHSLQSGNATAIARRTAVGINSVLGERFKDRLPNHQCPS